MGKCFSDAVEQALQYIYYNVRTGQGQEGFKLLEQASAAGDGDASCVLARCLCGYQYVWSGHGFPEDDRRATKLLHKSVEQGSALGVLVALRSGELTPSVQKKMPFDSLQEAFDIVLQKAEMGDAFCQYIIGNTYFWWDFLRIQNKGKDSFPNQAEFKAYLKENISKCEDWFWKALRGGIYFAGNNLNRYYQKGGEDIIPPQPEKAKDIWRSGAEYGYPIHQYLYAKNLREEKRYEEALEWFKRAAEGGEGDSWYYIGLAYENEQGAPKDLAYAAKCYEKGLSLPNATGTRTGCSNCLGAMYYDGDPVPKDYAKAFQLLNYAYSTGSTWGVCYLGKCYFRGWGTQQDYTKAREFLEQVTWTNREAFFMLGYIYGRGLGGVPSDIKKGVEYLQKAGDNQEAKEELLRYKKTLFGKWVLR